MVLSERYSLSFSFFFIEYGLHYFKNVLRCPCITLSHMGSGFTSVSPKGSCVSVGCSHFKSISIVSTYTPPLCTQHSCVGPQEAWCCYPRPVSSFNQVRASSAIASVCTSWYLIFSFFSRSTILSFSRQF